MTGPITPATRRVDAPAEDRRSEPTPALRPDARTTGLGIALAVLVLGAFVAGWRLGRGWGRLLGW